MKQAEKIVALDIGGVCIELHMEKCFRAFGLTGGKEMPEEAVRACFLLETGRISEKEWFETIRRMTGNTMTVPEILSAWAEMIGSSVPGMESAVRELAGRGYRFVYFSNTSRLHMDVVARNNSFGHLVTGGIYSYEVHAVKPEPAMYRAFEEKYGIPFAYFDDRAENVEAGKKAGWNAHLFRNAADFLSVLRG